LVNYGHLDESGVPFFNGAGAFIGTDILPETTTWYFKAGLRERWSHLGHTVLYGEYLTNNDGNNINICGAAGVTAAQCSAYDSELKLWGLGVVQEIDAAAMSIWLSYRHLEFDDNLCSAIPGAGDCANGNRASGFESFQYIKFGGLINY
jgi:hypothetical protein